MKNNSNWISTNKRKPEMDVEFDWHSIDVLVTDGIDWGFGKFYPGINKWEYTFIGMSESTDNNILFWAYPPKLPSLK